MPRLSHCLRLPIFLLLILSATHSAAASGSRLLATGGAMSVEGAAGGGIVPWALLAGYAESDEIGGAAWYTHVAPADFRLDAFGAAATFFNRVEVSVGKQSLDIDAVVAGETLEQTVFGLKYRISGDLVYTRLPQFSIGLLHKRNDAFDVPSAVGAKDEHGTDIYLSASKLWLAGLFDRSVFLNSTVRATRANQLGLLGFGGDQNNHYQLVGELSAGLFLNRQWIVGAEYRQKPDNLSFASEDDWVDLFVGWFPGKRLSVVAAWSDLGSIAGKNNQDAFYLSFQLSQ